MNAQAPLNILMDGIVGSTAHGLAREGSDEDTLGVFAASTREYAGLDWHSGRESIVKHEPDSTLHEAGKFIRLALKANPTILELLYLPEYTQITDLGLELIRIREYLLDPRSIRSAYGGFARAQLTKYINHDGKNHKTARHTLRLIRQGSDLLTTGHMTVKVPDPQTYFDLETMPYTEVVNMLSRELAAFDNLSLSEPYALTKYDRNRAAMWLNDVRMTYL